MITDGTRPRCHRRIQIDERREHEGQKDRQHDGQKDILPDIKRRQHHDADDERHETRDAGNGGRLDFGLGWRGSRQGSQFACPSRSIGRIPPAAQQRR